MNSLQSFMSDKRPPAEPVKLEDPRPDFLTQRIQSHAAFESEQKSDLQSPQASPLVRWGNRGAQPLL
jgi:hypothetical protein